MGYCHSRATKNSRSAMYATDKASELSWVAALAAGAAAQLVLAVMIARGPLPGLNVDDALHALAGAATWHDVVRLDLHSLYLDVYDQARWPPVGGFLLWPALAVFGPAEATYRLGILMWLVACVAAWTVAARAATENFRSAAWAGLILVLLALSSQFLLVASASVLCEIPGLAFMLGAYGAAHAAWERRCPRWLWLGGLLLAASWFTKWQYGIVATAALLLLLAHRRRLSGKTCGEIWLFLPSVVLVALWLASPYHLREMLMYLLWKPASAEKLRSYGAEFLRAVADAPLITKANLVATVVGLGLATRLSRRPVALALFAHLVIAALGSGLKDLSPRTGLWIA
ncbi:MAG: glycosyltransferase family 39 protein, partial [Armatimonadetes bacterium]|nr:glycosyltransferase family 39 protein [Armatimonadota bacterium]